MAKTAIELLIEDFKESGYRLAAIKAMHYLELEKLQIGRAWWAGHDERNDNQIVHASELAATEYYNRTYKSE